MTTGFSGTYAVNNVNFTLPPTSGHWLERTNYGIDGEGHVLYPATRSFEMVWELISTDDASQIIGFYNAISSTGTSVVCLPDWGNSNFLFRNYSGCTLVEPTINEYFQGYITNMSLKILNIRTN